ncbi:MAG: hypothetical protein KGI02_01005 [Thaumarchaeota archaeon]|nr:hypothetical protein [Nitrososphaerota archaeon]MDE1830928.1 hypothetical protein [Nitrososphaerota archaeon]MDE1840405.1 hypothetical protein [Nitrososphaerota archaeon]MDE1877410.1 hypothetical protein [Nitrososphaerota archaeon]
MTKRLLLASAVLSLLVIGMVSPVLATVDFNAYLPISGKPITPQFMFTKNVAIDYSNGGKLKDLLNGKNVTYSYSGNSNNNTSINTLMQSLNTLLATQRKTTATFSDLQVDYQVQVNGDSQGATIDYKIVLTPTLTGYMLYKSNGDTPTVFDVSWMGFSMTGPAVISAGSLGNLDINSPIGIIKSQLPDVYNVLKGTAAEAPLSVNLLDASALVGFPIEKWNALFDPAYTLSDAVGLGYKGQKVAVTSFAYGQSDLYQGSLKTVNTNVDFTTDAKYHLSMVERAGSGTLDVDGHANGLEVQGDPAISTTVGASANVGTTTAQGLSTMTIYAMAGFAAVIAVGIFIWSNKKVKDAAKRGVDTSPPPTYQYEERKHWADKFDEEKK